MSVRSSVFENLQCILSPNKEERDSGEQKLKALELTEDYGLVLTEICVDSNQSASLKQLAAVLLRQYVDVHWTEDAEKFSPPEATPHIKAAIRSLVPQGLTESDGRVRSAVAYVISSVAYWDWPEQWPQLFEVLMEALRSPDKNAVHGCMRVLTEFTREITNTQVTQIAPVLLPELYRIFTTTGQYSNRARSRAVVIFTTCANVIIALSQVDKSYIKTLLVPVLPQFIQAFMQALQSKNAEVTDAGIKTEILAALRTLVENVRAHIAPLLKDMVSCVWHTLVDSSELYLKTNIYEDSDLEADLVDSDGEVIGCEALIYAVFEFITILVEMPKFHAVIKENVTQLLYYITVYTQMTTEQELSWSQSPNQFVEDEDDESFSYSVRISAQELLQVIVAGFDDHGLVALAENIPAHLRKAEEMKQSGNPCWWKIHEAIYLALGRVPMMFVDAVRQGSVKFNIPEFLHNVVLSDLTNQGTPPFLAGRCIWLASRLSHCMDVPLIQKFLEATVAGLTETQPPCIRISAVRATYYYCENLALNKQTELLNPVLPLLFEGAMSVAQSYGTEVLALCLDSMETTLRVSTEFTASVAEKSMPLFMAVFLKYSHDQHIIEICREIIMQLAVARNDIVQQKMLPTLVSIIQQHRPDTLPSSLQPGSLEMIETLVRGSNEPISDELMVVFPMVANLTIMTDDSAVMQNGGECLRAFVSKSAQQVVQWQDDRGHTGLSIIGSVVSKLLDPKAPECSAAYVGKLVSLLISKLSDSIGSDLDLILRAVLSKLQQTDTPTIVQELIMVFARLVIIRVEALLDFLTMTPGPDGAPALKFVLTQWCSRQHLFYGSYETKVSSMALSKLLLHAINTNDTRLQEIYLKEEVISQSSAIRTRSKAKASVQEFMDTPILIKMYKLLINELAHQIEESQFTAGSTTNGHGDGDHKDLCDEEDDDEDDDDHELLSSLLEDDNLLEEDGDESDPDVLSDPLYHLNLKEYLVEFIKSFSLSQYYDSFRGSLSLQEQSVLKHVGVITS